jgi:hypothetical protein
MNKQTARRKEPFRAVCRQTAADALNADFSVTRKVGKNRPVPSSNIIHSTNKFYLRILKIWRLNYPILSLFKLVLNIFFTKICPNCQISPNPVTLQDCTKQSWRFKDCSLNKCRYIHSLPAYGEMQPTGPHMQRQSMHAYVCLLCT